MKIVLAILIPFFGTALGAAAVFLFKQRFHSDMHGALSGFCAGVMCAAGVWSLLLPCIECSAKPKWLCAAIGFILGVGFLIWSEKVHAALKKHNRGSSLPTSKRMLVFAVTLHNVPEGLAVGVSFAAAMGSGKKSALATAFALAVGIAVQNVPEGAVISMPLKEEGYSKAHAFCCGVLSGAVEPVAAALTLLLSAHVIKVLPFCLSFAAGAMFFVCVHELIPESKSEKGSCAGAVAFSIGFLVMMVLDVALG